MVSPIDPSKLIPPTSYSFVNIQTKLDAKGNLESVTSSVNPQWYEFIRNFVVTAITGIIIYDEIQEVSPAKLLGNATGIAANINEIGLTSALRFISNDNTLDINTNGITSSKIALSAVTYSKIQLESNATILGNNSGGSASPSEITPNNGLKLSGSALTIDSATATDENTATTLVKVSTPGVQVNHPGSIKAFGIISNSGTITINDSYRVSTVVRSSTGVIVVTLANAMSSSNYGVSINLNGTAGFVNYTISSASQFTIQTTNTSNSATDINFSFNVYGRSIL